MHPRSLLYFLLLLVLASCSTEDEFPEPSPREPLQMLHLAHTRMNSNPEFNPALTRVDYSAYDLLLLGGDLALDSSADRPTMDSLQNIFNLADPNTLLALGNHDYADLDLVEEYTQRPPFYHYHRDGITFLVLDTQDSLSNMVGEQLAMIEAVTDTLSASSHLILLHHKMIWMYGNEDLESQIETVANGKLGDCFYCVNPNNFYEAVYPQLVELENRGIEVLCIGGDLGFKAKTFTYLSPEGVEFLGSGMDTDVDDNPVLILEYELDSQELNYRFSLLKEIF